MVDERDELIERVARALKRLPPVNMRAPARIVSAARARRTGGPRRWTLLLEWMRAPAFSVASTALLAAAALAIGFITRGTLSALLDEPAQLTTAAATSSQVKTPGMTAANTHATVNEVPVPIIFDAAGAQKVSVVGDFNDWNSAAAPMTRFGPNGPWTATVNVTPGRHLYAFMVDGNLVVDPRAPAARDLDYGSDASVMMVNTP
jgi:hypothetical protein